MGQARSDPKSDNTVRAMAMSRKTIFETVPDTDENSQSGSPPADNPRCVTDSDWQGWRSANTSVLSVNEHSL